MKKQKAFTLTELIIGIAIGLIIMGAVVSAVFMATNIYEKSQANALITNSMRLTMAAYEREVMPRVNHAEKIEVLADNSELPSSLPSSYDYYLYLSGDSIMQWSDTKREPLGGSEYITSLTFNLKQNEDTKAENYTLSTGITAQYPKFKTIKIETDTKNALYNYESIKKSGVELGTVLHLLVKDQLSLATAIHVKKDDDNGEVLDEKTVSPGTSLYASYSLDITPIPDDFEINDTSEITWYISTTKDASPTIHLSTEDPNTVANPQEYCWQLVKPNGDPITGRTFDTKSNNGEGNSFRINVRDKKNFKWGQYGYIKYMIKPKAKNKNNTSETITGPSAASPWVAVLESGDPDSLWNLWATINNLDNSADGFFNMADNKKFSVAIDRESGNTVAILTGTTNDASSPSVAVAKIGGKYLKAQQRHSQENDGKSYTTVTNYSIIVDAELGNSDGIGLLLNGAGDYYGSPVIKDTGLMFQIANKTDTLPMRLYANGRQHKSASEKSWGVGNHDNTLAYTSDLSAYKFTGNGKTNYTSGTYGPFYGPGYLKNDIFKYTNDYYSNQTNATINTIYKGNSNRILGEKIFPYKERLRFMLTVLEYYINDKDRPHFIVRLKFLKEEDISKKTDKDPWMTGDEFFNSEPAWYGGFVGVKPQKTTSEDVTSKDYYVTVKNYSEDFNNNKIYFKKNDLKLITAKNPEEANFYATKVREEKKKEKDEKVIETLFEAKDINIYEEIGKTNFENNTNMDKAKDLFKFPSRDRFMGLRIWSNKLGLNTSDPYSVKVYSVELAPGFSKKELQAIMPKDAKMYELTDTQEENLSGLDITGLNNTLFNGGNSDGNGNDTGITNGVMGIQRTAKQ